ncbi:hypothetical protein [Catenovulum sediminis]|uniref:DNA polymerase III subunit psi n=1 Tax=Catenovulum sediminis TaxID=1740262 RepID=A0ABV1RER8_9ALTE
MSYLNDYQTAVLHELDIPVYQTKNTSNTILAAQAPAHIAVENISQADAGALLNCLSPETSWQFESEECSTQNIRTHIQLTHPELTTALSFNLLNSTDKKALWQQICRLL